MATLSRIGIADGGYAEVSAYEADAVAASTVCCNISDTHGQAEIYCSPAEARQWAYSLLAAADHCEALAKQEAA